MKILRSAHLHAGLCAGAILVLMMLPAEALPEFEFSWLPVGFDQWIDKIQHIVAFFVLTILMSRSMSETETVRHPILTAAALTLAYSFLLEFLQAPLPWRYFDVRDMVADTVGVVLALPLAAKYVRLTGNKGRHS